MERSALTEFPSSSAVQQAHLGPLKQSLLSLPERLVRRSLGSFACALRPSAEGRGGRERTEEPHEARDGDVARLELDVLD